MPQQVRSIKGNGDFDYSTPEINFLEITIENGFAATGSTDGWGDDFNDTDVDGGLV